MSRAVTTNTLRLRDVYQALKSASSSANAALSRVFSATNDYIKTMQELDRYIYQGREIGFSTVLDAPLGNDLPPVTDFPPLMTWDGFMHGDVQMPAERPALSYPQALPLPEGNVQNEQKRQDVNADDVEVLLAVLREKTHASPKVEALPSGAVKITLDEYFMGTNKREPEFVTVRR